MPWPDEVLAERAWRNELYTGPETPLAPEARRAFTGLRWWDVDARFRLEGVKLLRHSTPREAALKATGEDAIVLREIGALDFALLSRPARLLAYEPAPGESDEAYILIPFRDATSGKETYGGGRYLDLEPRADDVYEIDLNRAYHPYCAYDDAWACVLPPPENRLAARVEAGEKL